jgi:hypothetical protein
MIMEKIHIGDNVYLEQGEVPDAFILTTQNEIGETNTIQLDIDMITRIKNAASNAFQDYQERMERGES